MQNDNKQAPRAKVLDGIKPFNKFLFISCYYHQLVAAYSYYGIEPETQLANYYIRYEFDEKNGNLGFSAVGVSSRRAMERATGIRETVLRDAKDIVAETAACIRKGSPIIIAVDTYCLPYRETAYQKNHMPHYLLAYGYDDEKQEFTVSDHMHLNSVLYAEQKLGYDDFRKAFKGYMNFFSAKNDRAAVRLQKVGEREAGLNARSLTDFFRRNGRLFDRNAAVMEKIADCAAGRVGDWESDAGITQKCIVFFGKLRHAKLSQKNMFRYFYGADNACAKLCGAAADCAFFVSSVLCKISIAKTFAEPLKMKAAQKISEIAEAERALAGELRKL
ncbi:MAG: BtrH N-terminal domain-containing protein [Clostridiales bacterium]|jgi:hypothetical protein|nr:BtrH N-terminal domain-containing protein [Clostridiales bacterium]